MCRGSKPGTTTVITWSDSEDVIESLRDIKGSFLTPGFFTGLHGARATPYAMGNARLEAVRNRAEFYPYEITARIRGCAAASLAQARKLAHSTGDTAGSGLVVLDLLRLNAFERSLVADICLPAGLRNADMPFADQVIASCDTFFANFFASDEFMCIDGVFWNGRGGMLCNYMQKKLFVGLATFRPGWQAEDISAPVRPVKFGEHLDHDHLNSLFKKMLRV